MGIINSGTRVQPYLSRAIQEYTPGGMIAAMALRPIRTTEKSGTILKWDRESTMPRDENLQRAPGAAYARKDVRVSQDTYTCVGYGEEVPVPDEDLATYKSEFDMMMAGAKKVKGDLLGNREIAAASLLFNTTTWDTGTSALYTDVSSAPWDAAGSDVIGAVSAGAEQVRANTGLKANALILGEAQYVNLTMKNTAIRNLLSGIAVATPEALGQVLAAVLGLKYVFAGGMVKNSNAEGGDATIADAWADDYAMVARVAETDDPSEHCLGRIMVWEEIADADVRISTYREDQTDSTIVKGKLNEDRKIIDTYCGHLLKVDA